MLERECEGVHKGNFGDAVLGPTAAGTVLPAGGRIASRSGLARGVNDDLSTRSRGRGRGGGLQ